MKVLSVLTPDNVSLSLSDGGNLPAQPIDITPPTPGGGAVKVVAFSFASVSPLVLSPLLGGQSVVRVGILITTPFDGAGASLTLGTPGSPALLLASTDNRPSAAGQYESDAITPFAAPDTMQLTIIPGGGATQGAGQVFYELSG
jgi:hypothetical protein